MIQTEKTADLKMMSRSFNQTTILYLGLDYITRVALEIEHRELFLLMNCISVRDNLSSSSHGNDKLLTYRITFINVLPERNRIFLYDVHTSMIAFHVSFLQVIPIYILDTSIFIELEIIVQKKVLLTFTLVSIGITYCCCDY